MSIFTSLALILQRVNEGSEKSGSLDKKIQVLYTCTQSMQHSEKLAKQLSVVAKSKPIDRPDAAKLIVHLSNDIVTILMHIKNAQEIIQELLLSKNTAKGPLSFPAITELPDNGFLQALLLTIRAIYQGDPRIKEQEWLPLVHLGSAREHVDYLMRVYKKLDRAIARFSCITLNRESMYTHLEHIDLLLHFMRFDFNYLADMYLKRAHYFADASTNLASV